MVEGENGTILVGGEWVGQHFLGESGKPNIHLHHGEPGAAAVSLPLQSRQGLASE